MPVFIHGKEYKTVAERVVEFHALNKKQGNGTTIKTKVLKDDGDVVIVKAKVVVYGEGSKAEGERFTGEGTYTGHAEEVRGSTMINKTSALENAETSAIGRALASYGLVGTEFASADEVANAISQQGASKTPPPPAAPRGQVSASNGETVIDFGKWKGHKFSEIPSQYLKWLVNRESTDERTRSLAQGVLDLNDANDNLEVDVPSFTEEETFTETDSDELSFLDEKPKKEVSTGSNEVSTGSKVDTPMSPLRIHNRKQELAETLTGLSERIGWTEFTKIKQQELGKKGFKECEIAELEALQSILESLPEIAVKLKPSKKDDKLLDKVIETFDGEVLR